jgi:hypothetical protein
METMEGADWDDRIQLQEKWTNEEKGWQVDVGWKNSTFGTGVFAKQDIKAETILRIGTNGKKFDTIQICM